MRMIFRNKTPTGSEVESDLRNPADWFLNLFNNRGNNVTEESAISTSEVYSSVKAFIFQLFITSCSCFPHLIFFDCIDRSIV